MPRVVIGSVSPFKQIEKAVIGNRISAAQLADIWNCSVPTARKNRDNPELITLKEYRDLYRKGHIPVEELRFTW